MAAMVENHFDINEQMSAEQFEEIKNMAYHETPPVMFYLEDGKMVELAAPKPVIVSIDELAEREYEACYE